jgi:insertion element IS1 protein InsB
VPDLQQVNVVACQQISSEEAEVEIHKVEAAEMDEMWSFVGKKAPQHWLWHAIDHTSGVILADVCGVHEDEVFLQLKELAFPVGPRGPINRAS